MIGRGTSHGCVSVLNGIVSGTGAVIGTALETRAEYSAEGKTQTVNILSEKTDDKLARICVQRTLERIGADPSEGYILSVSSEIPPSRGLKSSSSVCNAVIKAVLDAHGVKMDIMDAVKLGVECAKEAHVTITGSFDDACGCELGGFVLTDNLKMEVLRQEPFPHYDVIISVPEKVKAGVPKEAYNARAADMEEIKKVCGTDILKAMTLNGRLVAEITGTGTEIMDLALSNGALAAGVSGTGPATAVICNPGDGRRIAAALPGRTIVTETRRCPT